MENKSFIVYDQGDPDLAIHIRASRPDWAAIRFHEEVFPHWEYPEHLHLIVIDQKGNRSYFTTTMEMNPDFYSTGRVETPQDTHEEERPVQEWLTELGAPIQD